MSDLTRLSAFETREAIARREVSAREVVEAYLRRIDQVDPLVHAFLTVTREQALVQAAGALNGPLAGVPVALKDNHCTRGIRTTCASRILENFVPPYDATVIRKLRDAGAILLGKTNMDEFAMGSSTENSAFQKTLNPWDPSRIPGGSSGGSAAAVAADFCAAATGSDTGGSIRQPAALCGVTGLKPTYGRVSRYGLVAFASSLDQIGPMTKDVRDAALMLSVIAGQDPMDATSAPLPVPDYLASLEKGVRGMRLGLPREYFGAGMDAEVEKSVRDAVEVYRKLGAEIVDLSLPNTEHGIATYYLIAPAEASSNLARYDGVHYGHRAKEYDGLVQMYSRSRDEGFGAEVKRRIMLGTFALSAGYYDAYYNNALKVRRLIKQDFDRAWEQVDAVVCPTSPIPAFKVGEKSDDPLQMYLCDVLTVTLNLAGLPGVSIPCGFTKAGLPVGLQVIGKAFDEETVLRVARAFERETDFHRRGAPVR